VLYKNESTVTRTSSKKFVSGIKRDIKLGIALVDYG
jgi:hypothetical protein